MNNSDEIQNELQSALSVARHALEEFNKEPLVPSKRGGPRLSPWFGVWVKSSEIAVRWCRQAKRDEGPGAFDVALDRLLEENS